MEKYMLYIYRVIYVYLSEQQLEQQKLQQQTNTQLKMNNRPI